ncbi:kinetochore-associated protein NSL1 homolog [Polypterus senegalus]|uniref:kinetochore-associated protein NSL1 homolog n=1 Tax=Polypterus senegalus TaxID=55291 RepID=UPI00196663B5|nr:kinetochore-associated protein NSL1 homolog [Polypterus senegalus]
MQIGSATGTSKAPVRCYSKCSVRLLLREVGEVIYGVLDGQERLSAEKRKAAIKQFVSDFETAVQDNITINDKPWQDVSDEIDLQSAVFLDDLVDECIFDTAIKRKYFPQKILRCFIKTLKSERELMTIHPSVKSETVAIDPENEAHMKKLLTAMPCLAKWSNETEKSMERLLQKVVGMSEVMCLDPLVKNSELQSLEEPEPDKKTTSLLQSRGKSGEEKSYPLKSKEDIDSC